MNNDVTPDIYFAVPGDIQTLTGGYGYDRRLLAGLNSLGITATLLTLSATFPNPDAHALADAEEKFAKLPDGSVVIADGLAFGVLDHIAEQHRSRLKIIALCHHPLALEAGLTKETAQQLQASEERALHASVAVLVTSQATANVLQQDFAIPQKKITVAKPGTDKQNFAACEGSPPVLLTVATLTPRKAHDVLIDALAQISHLDWTARFTGGMEFNGAWADHLRAKVIKYGLQERIQFLGIVYDLVSEYSNADVFVLPSLFEGFGMVFAEALSFGLPIVAARAGAVPDVVPETAGVLVPPGDADALAAALLNLFSQPALRRQLQVGAQQASHELTTWPETAAIVARLISGVKTQ